MCTQETKRKACTQRAKPLHSFRAVVETYVCSLMGHTCVTLFWRGSLIGWAGSASVGHAAFISQATVVGGFGLACA